MIDFKYLINNILNYLNKINKIIFIKTNIIINCYIQFKFVFIRNSYGDKNNEPN